MPQADTNRPLLVNSAEAARLLSIGKRKLWELHTTGELPSVRIGKAVRFSPADLADWIETKKKK